MKSKPGKYFIDTYGCQMNEHDSEKMAALLEDIGLSPCETPDEADVVIINTCSIREKAEHKVYSALGKLKAIKKTRPDMVTVVAGCVAQQEKTRLLKRADHLDLVVGTHSISRLPELVEKVRTDHERIAAVEFSEKVKSLSQNAPCKGRSPVCSYVTIMQGCSNFCTYCVVPHTRGPEQSRDPEEIRREVEGLTQRGVKEITLLGQNVNAYGKDRKDHASFARLLEALNSVDKLLRIRFTTSHPKDLDTETIRAMAELEKVCHHIHLPLQSGSNRILKKMNRGYTLEGYMEKIEALRAAIPEIAITADMIVGFPGETDEDFQATIKALETIRYDQIFSFKYSPRPSTAAEKLKDQVPEDLKAARLSVAHQIQDRITLERHIMAEGAVEETLIEGRRPGSHQLFGRTGGAKIVNIPVTNGLGVGDLVNVRIKKGLKHSLLGEALL
jgi:tRNA-2-methylthio-N6-dimethylallyladenosine synthase